MESDLLAARAEHSRPVDEGCLPYVNLHFILSAFNFKNAVTGILGKN